MNKVIRSRPYYKGVTRELMSPSQRTGKLRYEPGAIVEADSLDENADRDCGSGINFCSTVAQALKWGPVVVELTVPDGETIIDAGDKLRAKRIRVEAVAYLSGAYLRYAYLSGANLRGADLRGANLFGADLSSANLRDANLFGADLHYAYLSGANLRGADLRGANLRGADLSSAIVDLNTIIPLPRGWVVGGSVIRRDDEPIR